MENRVPTVRVLNVPVAALTRAELSDEFERILRDRRAGWFSYVNVYAVNLAREHQDILAYFHSSVMTYCDGAGVILGARILGKKIPERIVLTDWIYDVAERASRTRARVYLLGSTDEVCGLAARTLQQRFPDLQLVGWHQGYLDDAATGQLIERINDLSVDLLIVGMGMPRQERWIRNATPRLRPLLVLNAGSCFDYVAGKKPRAPLWMQRAGLEWMFRLLNEPRRLWKRYLIGNPLFLFRVMAERLRSHPAADSPASSAPHEHRT